MQHSGKITFRDLAASDDPANRKTVQHHQWELSATDQAPSALANLRESIKRILPLEPLELTTVTTAASAIDTLSTTVSVGWKPPLISHTLERELVLEWWNEQKKLTMYVQGSGIEFIKVWGPDIDSEMLDGPIESRDELVSLWEWLFSH